MREKIRKRSIWILLLLMLLACCGMGYMLWEKHQVKDPFADDINSKIGIMPGMNRDEIQDRLNKVLADDMMNITINPKPVFQNGKSEGLLCIENIKQNHVNYIVTIKLEDGTQIYESGFLRPNHYIESAKLDKNLKKGEYPAIAYFKAYDDGKKFVGSSMVKLLIQIRN